MKRYLFAIAASAVIATPAMAEYYIIQGSDENCEVVETVPENTLHVGPLSFTTRNEAERELEVVCKDFDDDESEAEVIIEKQ